MNLELNAQLTESCNEVVDYNGFVYNLYKMKLNYIDDVQVLIPAHETVSVGDVISTTSWKLIPMSNSNPAEIAVRVNRFSIVTDGRPLTNYLNSNIAGLLLCSNKCVLKEIGPDKKPFYIATLKIRDSRFGYYDMMTLAFDNVAKKLSTVPNQSVIQGTATLKRRRNSEGYELIILDFSKKSEDKI